MKKHPTKLSYDPDGRKTKEPENREEKRYALKQENERYEKAARRFTYYTK